MACDEELWGLERFSTRILLMRMRNLRIKRGADGRANKVRIRQKTLKINKIQKTNRKNGEAVGLGCLEK